ncbi:MAG: FkbM family methyltransferase, partial [Mangrovicoccus sp.]
QIYHRNLAGREFRLWQQQARSVTYPSSGILRKLAAPLLRKALARFDKFARSRGYVPEIQPSELFQTLGLAPREIIDAGVMKGTPWLYDSFPEAKFYLVEPQKGMLNKLEHQPKDFVCIPAALGTKPGTATLQVDRAKSSLLARTDLTKGDVEKSYEVSITTLDRIISGRDLQGPVGIKLDIEGYELEALKGLWRQTDKVAFLIAELSLMDRFEDSYSFAEFVALADKKGFRFMSILNSPWAAAPMPFYDCLFLPKHHPAFAGKNSGS